MTLLALIRHAPTAWSNEGRMQGRSDVPLASPLPDWRWPPALHGFRAITSPLRRAVETARLLGVSGTVEPLLIEMDWGDWEGKTLAELRSRLGSEMEDAEAQGLDFRPPRGESPRDVQTRVAPLLRDIARAGEPVAAITHKGMIRAVFALATGWDMLGKPPARLSWDAAHLFWLGHDGAPRIERLNIALGGGGVTASVLFYVQWLLGIGHLQRSLRIAEALVGAGADVTLVLGGPATPGVAIDSAIRRVQLPPIRALDAGFVLVDDRDEPICDEFRAMRRARLLAALDEAQPDVVVIEGFPFARRAFAFELDPLVAAARAAGARVACSVRDVIVMRDDPKRHRAAIERVRSGFDRVMVHGDPDFIPFSVSFPPAEEIADRLGYTGYVANLAQPDSDAPEGEIVVSAGGGKAGAALMRAALEARLAGCLKEVPWRLLTGMNVDDGEFGRLCEKAPAGVAVERFRADFPALLRRCRVSVSQCGYNTALDIVAARAAAVLVPFAALNETEQLTRAEHMAARGGAVLVREDELTPAQLGAAIEAAALRPPKPLDLDTGGARRSAEIITALASRDGDGMIAR